MGAELITSIDLDEIKRWVKRVKKKDFHPKEQGDTPAWTELNLPYKAIGAGKNRIVYDLNNGFVLKVAISIRGIENNKTEAMIYRSARSSLKVHLAKVVDYGYGWNIMKKYDALVTDEKDNWDNVYKLQSKFLRKGMIPIDLVCDKYNVPKWYNIRFDKKGKLVVIDYGAYFEI